MRYFILLGLLFLPVSSFAFQARNCAEKVWMKKGMLRKYDVKYSNVEFISFKTSSDEGSTKVSSESSMQSSTMVFDPGITTGQSTSTTQGSSSFGECSIWANNNRWMRREYYVAENIENIRNDIAKGDGEYLDTLSFLSGCTGAQVKNFSLLVHKNYSDLFKNDEHWGLGSGVDQLLNQDAALRAQCNVFPTSI